MRYFILFLILNTYFTAWQQKPVLAFHLSGYAQGTTYSITYFATDSVFTQSQAERVFKQLDSSLSLYKPYSLINAFNNATHAYAIDEHLQQVVQRSLQVYRATGGAFDITVWPLVNAWGFGLQKITEMPNAATISRIMPCIGSDKLRLQGNLLQKQLPCIQIDVNGIAQGYSVDVFAHLLEARGITNYLVEIGGELRVSGTKPGNEPIRIGVEAPDHGFAGTIPIDKIIVPGKGAITTSGSYRRFYESNGRTITHIIDPRTGQSMQTDLISVTVFAKDAITADAYDNALMLMGLNKALDLAERNNEIEAYFVYRNQAGKISDTATAGFYKIMKQ